MTTPPEIKRPCPMRWSDMRGDSHSRFCEHCQLHVENLSAMSKRGIARVLARSEDEHVCVAYTRRADGTLVTRWASILDGVIRPFRRAFSWLLAASVPVVLSACQTQSQMVGEATPNCKTPPQSKTASADQGAVIVTGGI